MNWTLITCGFLFLMDPVVGLHELLPDFIGTFLIMLGLRDTSYMVERIAGARRRFLYLTWVSIIKFLLNFTPIDKIHTLPLTVAFSISIIEIMLFVSAIRHLFSGIEYTAMRFGGGTALTSKVREGFYYDERGVRCYGSVPVDSTNRIKVTVCVFFVVRCLLSVVPELPALQLADSTGVVGALDFSTLGTFIGVAVFAIELVFAVIVFIALALYFRRLRRNREFNAAIDAELETRFGDRHEIRTSSAMKTMLLVCGILILAYMGFYDYQINVVPRFIAASVVIIVSVLLFFISGRQPFALAAILPAVVTIPLSVVTHSLQVDYYDAFRRQMMALYESDTTFIYDQHINRIREGYYKLAFYESAEAVLCGTAIVLVLIVMFRLALGHAESFSSIPGRQRDDVIASVRKRSTVTFCLCVLCVAAYIAYRFVLPYFSSMPAIAIGLDIAAFVAYFSFAVTATHEVYDTLY